MALALLGPAAGLVASGLRVAGDAPLPTIESVLPELRNTRRANPELFGRYYFRQRITSRDRDDDGMVRKTTVRDYDVRPNAWGAPAEWVLVQVDGKPVPRAQVDKNRKDNQRRWQGTAEKLARLRRQAAERQLEVEEAIDEVFRVIDARIVGRVEHAGLPTLEIAFEPRPKAAAKTQIGKLFRKTAGRVWISEDDYQLVRFEGELVDTILYGWGLVARLHRGSRLEFERRLVDDAVWLPANYHLQGSVRRLLFSRDRFDRQSEFFEYERVDAPASGQSR